MTRYRTNAAKGFSIALGSKRFYLDPLLMFGVMALLLIGFVILTSASLNVGEKLPSGNPFYYPVRQSAHIVIGLVMGAAAASLPLWVYEKIGPWLFLLGVALLVLVLIVGVKVNGSMRWLSVAGVRIQVSEAAKLFAVIYMAGYMTRHVEIVRVSWSGMMRPLFLLSFACLLILLEPDFGSAAVILMTAMLMMFLGGARLRQFAVLAVMLSILGALLIWSSPYRLIRVTSFLDPWQDPNGSGFQLTQAEIAFGRGEWFGVGLGSSLQKLSYLPEAHTDFIFSVLAEELGLAGTMSVILLFAVVVWRIFVVARNAEWASQPFGAFLGYGLGLWFGLQAFINIGVNMGMLPTKGLTLPLMSYGGGSMVITCIGLGILFRVHHEAMVVGIEKPQEKPKWVSV